MGSVRNRRMRNRLCEAQNHRCCYCSQTMKNPTIEHYQAKFHGGRNNWENLVAACYSCNTERGSQNPMKFWAKRQAMITAALEGK